MAHHLSLSIQLTGAASGSPCVTTVSARLYFPCFPFSTCPPPSFLISFNLSDYYSEFILCGKNESGCNLSYSHINVHTQACIQTLLAIRRVWMGLTMQGESKCFSAMKCLIWLLPFYSSASDNKKAALAHTGEHLDCDFYSLLPHTHTHTHTPLDLAYSLPQPTWPPLIIIVQCCRALMINLCSFLGLC